VASQTLSANESGISAGEREIEALDLGTTLRKLLSPLASLKLTVVLFALAIVLVLIGTLAQARADIWDVIDDYFRTAIAWVPLNVLFPPSFFPGWDIPDHLKITEEFSLPLVFPFPGGWLIGVLMGVNLLAAHGLRFKVQARGSRMMAGLGLIVVGMAAIWLVIASGSNSMGLQNAPILEWKTLWSLILGVLAVIWLGVGYALIKIDPRRKLECWLLAITAAGLGGVLLYLFFQGDQGRLGDSSMRILWQLIKATLAGLILLAGCTLLFKKRGGMVLLHWGIALLMFNELFVGLSAVEGQMAIQEGQTATFTRDVRELELAVIDPSDEKEDHVVVIPQSMIGEGSKISHEWLPFDIEVVKFLKNSSLRKLKKDDENLATTGTGKKWLAEEVRAGTGADTGGEVDTPAAYIKLTDKKSGKDLGTYLVGLILTMNNFPENVTTTDGKEFNVSLRFKREYKNYAVTLIDVRKDDYLGTNTPRNYSSEVRLVDETRNVDREIKIWMNNPLRFGGETFYQSSYNRDPQTGTESTTLAVVTNAGWMIPYVCCMIVAIGMTAHFGIVLMRFLDRRTRDAKIALAADQTAAKMIESGDVDAPQVKPPQPTVTSRAAKILPGLVVVFFALYLGSKAAPPRVDEKEMNLYEFGKLPLVFEGRVKPFDTLARNSLKILSNYQTFKDEKGDKQPAIRWLLDVMSGAERAENHRVFRIENLEVLETLGLKKREGFRYSVAELRPKSKEFHEQADKARKLDKEDLSVYQRKVLELDGRIRRFTLLQASFVATPFPPLPSEEKLRNNDPEAMAVAGEIQRLLERAMTAERVLNTMPAPLAVPNLDEEKQTEDPDWQPFTSAWTRDYVQTALGRHQGNPAVQALGRIFTAYKAGDTDAFNQEVVKYRDLLEKQPPAQFNVKKTDFEAYFNHAEPFFYSAVLYLIAFVLAALSWLGWSTPLNRSAFWLIVMVAVVHTAAGIGRIYISGRPPVTNLYSSAVFIGWGCVLLGIILEAVFRLGIGNVIASVAGFIALGIAHILAGDGDTFVVLQAVLDTQFWLATHVVCITLGYATTFVAGLLGLLYVLRGALTPSLTPKVGKDLTRMIYGTVCFSILFSFVGTVLGGLWADDSWGRFWGWDPKENGALIIVLWNALVLHARWGGLVKERGLAVLAVGGNIVTAWSWFGVNELGVGLHSYGFTDGVLRTLAIFVASQIAVMWIGAMPQRFWLSHRKRSADAQHSA